ncbi:protein kinase domain-containing protein [Intrasporangium flavum]|uniref:protein kinase domain-containing protein n=1 Tax=Intrasporangium flavum TaxID=1428657 RepID=UPI00096D3029|nr:protein kinase [Intrasporangium flavum]
MSVDPASATRLAGRYRLSELIAVGGMGEVHLAVDERLGRRVAVKIMSRAVSEYSDSVERFRREAVVVARLNHPNIAQVYDYGVEDGAHFIVMEYAEGSDLSRVLRERGPLEAGEALSVTTQVCAALAAAHRAGVVHRDIKPGNVIVGPDGSVKVTDFGIARALGQAALTDAGTVLGTAQYLPPEQVRGEPATPASDLYALGILLFQMVTGTPPFTGDSPVAIAMRHLDEAVPAPSAAVPGLPGVVDRVVARATAKAPGDRYRDADAMARAVRSTDTTDAFHPADASAAFAATRALPTQRTPAAAPPAPTRDRSGDTTRVSRTDLHGPARRRPGLLVWGAVAAVLAVVFVGAVVYTLTSGTEAPATASSTKRPAPTLATTSAPEPTTAPPTETAAPVTTEPAPQDTGEGDQGDGVRIPGDLVGGDPGFARAALEQLGLDVEQVEVRSRAPEGEVLATFPRANRSVPPGSTVAVVVSKGGVKGKDAEPWTVPNGIVGAPADDVESWVDGQGIKVERVELPADADQGLVVGSYPGAGATTRSGQLVLFVSKGRSSD